MVKILIATYIFFQTSFYSLHFNNANGNDVGTNNYQGKKVLIVNVATNSSRVNQLAGLQQLYTQYGDSLVVIAFPTNSFNHESRTSLEVKQFCENTFGTTFPIAAVGSVTGSDIQSVYNWLTNASENGVMNNPVQSDFQKFLINGNGQLIGVFDGSVDPLSEQITNAITADN
jgi:glutathione peroxidase